MQRRAMSAAAHGGPSLNTQSTDHGRVPCPLCERSFPAGEAVERHAATCRTGAGHDTFVDTSFIVPACHLLAHAILVSEWSVAG